MTRRAAPSFARKAHAAKCIARGAIATGSAIAAALAGASLHAAPQLAPDIPAKFHPADRSFDFVRREIEIRMRDGVTLHTVLIMKKGITRAPILLDRTPYHADEASSAVASAHGAMLVRAAMAPFLDAGYILATQDVRGKYGSKGDYVNERPLIGPENPTKVDHATDAWDTIDWLVKHVPETNGRVGMIGTSYDGMMVLMALSHPHPALRAAVPANPVANTWMGDDDFHGGAARIVGYDYYFSQDTARGSGDDLWRDAYDDYDTFLRAGSTSDFVKSRGLDQLGMARKLHDHQAYDGFWRAQALDDILATKPQTVPTLFVAGQWDQEDMYGAIATFEKVKPHDAGGVDHLVIGPWRHGGWAGDGSTLGPVRFDADTALWFRKTVLMPFLDANLKDGAPRADLPPVLAFQTGANRWQRLDRWPLACATGCAAKPTMLYLQPRGGLAFSPPAAGASPSDSYVSDPTKPIPYRIRPIRPTYAKGSTWGKWLVDDQRPFSDRPDVLVYETAPLTRPVAVSGAPVADLVAATTGSDVDWVVKLIDVYPDEDPDAPDMGGYQLGVAMDILRGRYRQGFTTARPVQPNIPLAWRVQLPNVNHVFLPGHRIMVQIQSSWFPLYDRNPQTFVPNVFDARPGDYARATQTIFHAASQASAIELPVVTADTGG